MIRSRVNPREHYETKDFSRQQEQGKDHSEQRKQRAVLRRLQKTRKFPIVAFFTLVAFINFYSFLHMETVRTYPEKKRLFESTQEHEPTTDTAVVYPNTGKNEDGRIIKQFPQPTEDGSICYYDGHCPALSFCVPISDESVGYGTCMPFASEGSEEDDEDSTCYDACLKELQLDEHFYHNFWPVVSSNSTVAASSQRPKGCVVSYRREPEGPLGKHWQSLVNMDNDLQAEVSPSIQHWVDTRFRHIKRVDSHDHKDDHWMAFCTAPCISNATCNTVGDAFYCDSGACVRNNDYWNESPNDMVIVTGATNDYYSGLVNLCASARHWAPQHKVVVYNLGGLTDEQIQTIESWSNVLSVEWKGGVPDHYPDHVKIGKIYAWKPIILNETVHKYQHIFWLDAGDTLTGSIEPAIKISRQNGIMLFKGQDEDMKPYTSSKSFEWFGYDKETMETGPSFAGASSSFLYPSRYVSTVVERNAACALDKECISPGGSSLGNHRYDQSTLTILAYAVWLPHFTEYIAAQPQQLRSPQNLFNPSFRFVWMSRQTNMRFALNDPETGPALQARREKNIKVVREYRAHQKAQQKNTTG